MTASLATPSEADLKDKDLLDELSFVVSRAAAEILRLQAAGLNVRDKADHSPVTAADEASEALILDGFARLLPGFPVLSEEAMAATASFTPAHAFAVVDPLDGTREFIANRDEFSINVAIVYAGRPIVGLVAAPARGILWRGRIGSGADRLRLAPGAPVPQATECVPIHVRKADSKKLVAVTSRSHLDPKTGALLEHLCPVERTLCGSGLKFCLLAEGSADIYPRLAPTSEWDVAAGDAILHAAGGSVITPEGPPILYGRADRRFLIPHFIARGDPEIALPPLG